jgi:hypothetical protein
LLAAHAHRPPEDDVHRQEAAKLEDGLVDDARRGG